MATPPPKDVDSLHVTLCSNPLENASPPPARCRPRAPPIFAPDIGPRHPLCSAVRNSPENTPCRPQSRPEETN